MSGDILAPTFKIFVDGTELSAEAGTAVLGVTVDLWTDAADLFTIRLSNPHSEISDGDTFAVGKKVKVDLGYKDALTTVIEGEITGWKAGYPRRGPSTLTVFGYDKFHRLRRGRNTKTYLEMTDSDIAKEIAGNLGLSPKVDSTSVTHDYVCQHNQTDIDFLKDRAARLNYEVDVVGNDLIFKKPRNAESKIVSLKWTETAMGFEAHVSTIGQVTDVEVRGWDPKQKKAIVGKAAKGDVENKMSGSVDGPGTSSSKFGEDKLLVTDVPVRSVEEADAVAKAWLNKVSQKFLKGRGECLGDPKIQAGTVVEMEGLGSAYDGPYYVERAVHNFHRSGYTTTFYVHRTAVGKVSGAPPSW